MPLFAEHGFGWYLWELMIGKTQVDPPWDVDRDSHPEGVAYQRLLYPEGSPYDPAEVDLIKSYSL